MKKITTLLLISLALIEISCTSTILRLVGLRTPKIENKSSVLRYLEKIREDTVDVFAIDSSLFKQLQNTEFKPGIEKGFRPIQIRIYDKTGKPVIQWTICEGALKDLDLFDTIPPRIINGIDTSLSLQKDLVRYFTLAGDSARIYIPSDFDYYILIYFAKYFPKHSKESFAQINRYVRNYPEKRFKIYKINVDVQEFWQADVSIETQTKIGGINYTSE